MFSLSSWSRKTLHQSQDLPLNTCTVTNVSVLIDLGDWSKRLFWELELEPQVRGGSCRFYVCHRTLSYLAGLQIFHDWTQKKLGGGISLRPIFVTVLQLLRQGQLSRLSRASATYEGVSSFRMPSGDSSSTVYEVLLVCRYKFALTGHGFFS